MSKILTSSFDTKKFFILLSDVLRTRRQEVGLTQLELINLLKKQEIKVSQAYLSQLEAGQRKEPSAKIVIALCAVLGVELDAVIHECKEGKHE